MQDMVEKGRHDAKPAAVRQPVGVQRHEGGAADHEQPETGPGGGERKHVGPGCGRAGSRQAIDDATEQHGFGELRRRERHIGETRSIAVRLSGARAPSTRA